MLIDITSQVRITEYDFRNANPNIAFPATLTDAMLAPFNKAILFFPQQITPSATQKVEDGGQSLINGVWTVTWNLVDKTPDEMAACIQAMQVDITNSVQDRLNQFANTRGYDNIGSAASYANIVLSANSSPIETRIQSEGNYANTVRIATWVALELYSESVLAGTIPQPTSYADVEPHLPVLAWPI